jgi:phosphohistidine phosphatase
MQRLYLVRHGIALDVGEQGIREDADRPLSAKGFERTRLAAMGAQRFGVQPVVIGSSPLVRAWQTAQLFAEVLLGDAAAVERCDFMAPGGSDEAFYAWLRQARGAALLVGHMPDLVWRAQGCLPADQRQSFVFKKAAVAAIRFDGSVGPGLGRWGWMMPPSSLRALAESGSTG